MGQRRSSGCVVYVLRAAALVVFSLSLSGCSVTYLAQSGYEQAKLLNARRPLKDVLSDPKTDAETKRKLELVQAAQRFAISDLGFLPTKNYQSFVQLDRPYVTWVVTVAHAQRLEYELFQFPLVGKVPYKGFFNEAAARAEAARFEPLRYDTWVRGITAYSTLGWFDDPILSSMLRGQDEDLVEVTIHESAHATLYIKNSADFNEQLATFLGQEGTRRFFLKKEGPGSPTLKRIADEAADQKLFSQFLKTELAELKTWYAQNTGTNAEVAKAHRLKELQVRFQTHLKKKLKTSRFDYFVKMPLNNAILLGLGTYMEDLSLFQKLLDKKNGDMTAFLAVCRGFKSAESPARALQDALSSESHP
jgi:predicted aminopeptidase